MYKPGVCVASLLRVYLENKTGAFTYWKIILSCNELYPIIRKIIMHPINPLKADALNYCAVFQPRSRPSAESRFNIPAGYSISANKGVLELNSLSAAETEDTDINVFKHRTAELSVVGVTRDEAISCLSLKLELRCCFGPRRGEGEKLQRDYKAWLWQRRHGNAMHREQLRHA